MKNIEIHHYEMKLTPNPCRVIIKPFISHSLRNNLNIIQRTLSLSEKQVQTEYEKISHEFRGRHTKFESSVLEQYQKIKKYLNTPAPISKTRQLLLGCLFSGEYSLEAAALFNPSMVPHPDQSGLPAGAVRFIMSLRATGEGHISSLEFRSGILGGASKYNLTLEEPTHYLNTPNVIQDPTYKKSNISAYLKEMGIYESHIHAMFEYLHDSFTKTELMKTLSLLKHNFKLHTSIVKHLGESLKWYVDSNYQIQFEENSVLSERVLFPHSQTETNGIEDARFVRFHEQDAKDHYYATYTAYNGKSISPQLISTSDFLKFRISTLTGNGVKNKGMALFPRRIGNRYAMLSRQDDQNLFLMYSDNLYQWKDPELIAGPAFPWEYAKIGNCGSPLETKKGWLVLTHGVGPMRKYCIGAILLDLENPGKILGRLKCPLLEAREEDREGYVPNVVYSCGSMLVQEDLILPYAMSDTKTGMVNIKLKEILNNMEPA